MLGYRWKWRSPPDGPHRATSVGATSVSAADHLSIPSSGTRGSRVHGWRQLPVGPPLDATANPASVTHRCPEQSYSWQCSLLWGGRKANAGAVCTGLQAQPKYLAQCGSLVTDSGGRHGI